jgi:DnaJ family protein C protein 28
VVDEKSIEEEIKTKAQQAKKLARYMSSTEDLVENQIRKAMEKGEFDNLEGAGKPIPLEENPYEPVGMRMVNKILKDNDFAPYWIELGKQIDHEWEKIQRDIENFKKYSTMILGEKRTKAGGGHIVPGYTSVCFRNQAINRPVSWNHQEEG